jgi:predicted enzyme related to lactoylglutathione lyase
MIKVSNAQLWVHDQEEALAFYTEKLGWEVRSDVTLPEVGDFRWLTVSPAGQDDFEVVLMAIPGPPVFQEDTAEMLREVVSRGVAATIFLTTDDIHGDYEALKARGVEFVEAPEERPWGADSSFRDPSGNHIRLTQPKALAELKEAAKQSA